MLEHLPDARLGLAELSRVMMPGARMLLLTTEDTFSGAWTSRMWCCRTYNRRELAQICESVGLGWHRELWFTRMHKALRRRHLRGTGEGRMRWLAAVILLLVVALSFGLSLPAYAIYALLGVMLVSRWLARHWSQSISAVRECNRYSVNVGDTVAVVVTLKNSSWLPVVWAMIEDLLPPRAFLYQPPSLQVKGRRIQLMALASRGRHTMFYQLLCNRRGYHQIGPLVVETGDLFGLHRRYRVVTSSHFLLVYPQVVALEGFDLASRRPIGEVRIAHRLYEDPTRIAGVRRYEAGDPLNRIHWKATARTGVFHSKVYEPSCIVGATLVVDFHQAAYDPHQEPYRSELSVTAAASLANAVYEMDQQIGMVTNGRDAADRIRQEKGDSPHLPERPEGSFAQMGTVPFFRSRKAARRAAGMLDQSDRLRPLLVETRRGPEQLLRILETLARVELTDGLTFAQLLAETAGRIPRDATVVALLASPSVETIVALGELHRRGLAVTAILNLYDDGDFERAWAQLAAEGIDARHLKTIESLPSLCEEFVLR